MSEINTRIKEAMASAGVKNAAELGRMARIAGSTVRAYVSGERSPPLDVCERIGSVLGVSAHWIFYGTGDRHTKNDLATPHRANSRDSRVAPPALQREPSSASQGVAVTSIPVRGIVAAGFWMRDDEDVNQAPEFVPAYPEYEPSAQIAFRVSGPSMDRAGIADGGYVICLDIHAIPDIESGDVVVVEQIDGHFVEKTCKTLAIKGGRYELWPESSDPNHQEPIVVPDPSSWQSESGTEIRILGRVIATISPIGRRRPRRG